MLKKRNITLLLAIITTMFVSAFTFERADNPTGMRLEDNEEYQQLMAESQRLAFMNDSISRVLDDTRASMRHYVDTVTTGVSREYMSQYSQRIVELENEIFKISTMQGEVGCRINEIEMEFIVWGFNKAFDTAEDKDNATQDGESSEVIPEVADAANQITNEDDTDDGEKSVTESEMPITHRNLIDNEVFMRSLDAKDMNELRVSQREEADIEPLVQEYIKNYNTAIELDEAYAKAENQHDADSIYTAYSATLSSLESLNAQISNKWNYVIDTKYYAYGYVVEKERNMALLGKLDDEFTKMLRQCAKNDDLYASNGVMRYAIGRPVVIEFEKALSSQLGLTAATDSLSMVQQEYVAPDYQLSPVELPERRLFLDFSDITFGRTNYYNDHNPIPDVKVYERGTIYRILLGVFKSRQPMTLFKGVQPLYIEKDGKGYNHYYAGGFATLEEAEAAQRMLFNKGFKSPEICCWMNGSMTNLTEGSGMSADSDTESSDTKRYMLRIGEQDMSEEIERRITEQYPNKIISRTHNEYIIGTFDNHDDVTRLFIMLSDEFGIDLEILEVELK